MNIKANLVILSKSFITVFSACVLVLAVVVGIISFVMWTIPPVPSIDTMYFVLRVLLAISTLFTFMYALSNDYKQSVLEYLYR